MAYFIDINQATVVATLEFVNITSGTMQQVRCKNGEVAGFRILSLPVLGESFLISQIYDCSTGTPVLTGTVSVVPGIDLTGGLFSSGCMAGGDPFDAETRFYKVDYV